MYRPLPTSMPIALTFVDAHLAAFDEALDRRNADFHDISRRLTLGPCTDYVQSPQVGIFHTDALIWMVCVLLSYLMAKVHGRFYHREVN